MDNRVYVWIFNNINKYEFHGNEANRIKSEISRMLVTEDSIHSEAISTKMSDLYSQLCGLFYNNILGYQNGLARNPITASSLDCYFITTTDGMVPIGYYRIQRPAEAASIVQKYLDQCKREIGTEKNQMVVNWQTKIDSVSVQYESIKNSKNPSVVRTVLGVILVVLTYAFSVFSMIRMNLFGVLLNWGNLQVLQEALANIPIISYGTHASWIGYLIFVVLAVAIATVGTIFIVKSFQLISAKGTTKRILTNILPYVSRLEQGVSDSIENSSALLYDAARKGENYKIIKTASAMLASTVDKQIQIANNFTTKTEKQRKGIGYFLIILLFILVILFSLSCSQGIADSIETMRINKGQAEQNLPADFGNEQQEDQDDEDFRSFVDFGETESTEVYEEEPKVSSYAAFTSDATWTDANQYAQDYGGYLACINTEEEFYKVCNLADEQGLKVFWVGARRNSYDNWMEAEWLDGEPINYTNWLSGEPTYFDENGSEENYLMVFKVKSVWYFNDATNDVSMHYPGKMGYIVEIEE